MNNKRVARLGRVAFIKTKKLDKLIATLQNTTIGTINDDINNIELNINNLYNANDIINTKINSIASLFGITFNTDGTVNLEAYTQHTHDYTDTTITDTEDGTGTEQSTDKQTSGITE